MWTGTATSTSWPGLRWRRRATATRRWSGRFRRLPGVSSTSAAVTSTSRASPRCASGAAMCVQPIQGEGGYGGPPPGYLKALRGLCDRHGILLVCDEVQSGIGRIGRMFACEYEGIEPDVVLVAKGLGSGMPIGAIIAKQSIMTWRPGAHGSTSGGNPVCCAAALATLDVVERELLPNVAELGGRLLSGTRRPQAKYAAIGDVRGRGAMVGVEFVKDRATREPAPEIPHELVERAFRKGLLVLGAGKDTVRLAPPLVVDEDDVDTALRIIDECLREIAD